MSPRTGRPTDSPKKTRIAVRLEEGTAKVLELYCNQEKVSEAEAARRGIKKLEEDIKSK